MINDTPGKTLALSPNNIVSKQNNNILLESLGVLEEKSEQEEEG